MEGSNEGFRVGFIGYGTSARQVEAGMRDGSAGAAHLAAVLVRRELENPPDAFVTLDRSEFLAQPLDLVVELAGQDAVRQHGEAVLAAGRDLMIISIGVLADDDLRSRLESAARKGK